MVIVRANGELGMIDVLPEYTYSGAIEPTTFDIDNKAWWYDTTNNIIKRTQNSGITWTTDDYSLPIALVSIENGIGIISIDQVFNGFGYIGSTVFALPGISGLAPNGRNRDGSLKNSLINVEKVLIKYVQPYTSTLSLYISSTGIECQTYHYEQEENPDKDWSFWFIPSKNEVYFRQASGYTAEDYTKFVAFKAGYFDRELGVVTDLRPNNTFNAVNYNDTDFISNQSMPSNKYIDLTLGAVESEYTAPADGYFNIKWVCNQYGWFWMGHADGSLFNTRTDCGHPSNGMVETFLPVRKGDTIRISYGDLVSASDIQEPQRKTFRFVYAQGAK